MDSMMNSTSIKPGAYRHKLFDWTKALSVHFLIFINLTCYFFYWYLKNGIEVACKAARSVATEKLHQCHHVILKTEPKHCGGQSNPNPFEDLKKWFYGEFNKKCRLSKCWICQEGRILPKVGRRRLHQLTIILPVLRCPSNANAEMAHLPQESLIHAC